MAGEATARNETEITRVPEGTELQSPGGHAVRLDELYTDRPLVLAFLGDLVNPFTGDQAAQLRDAYDVFDALEMDIVAVAATSPEAALQFHQRWMLPYPVLADPQRAAFGALGVTEGTATFVVDGEGGVRAAFRSSNLAEYPSTSSLFPICSEITGVEPPAPPPPLALEFSAFDDTPGVPAAASGGRIAAGSPFACPKCAFTVCERLPLATASGMMSRMFNVQHRRFIAVVCSGCGYTELYKEQGSMAANVVDVLAG
jgi:predicted nucleic-acid-binding Zn-ribbon protein/peroxiredoxin